MKRLLFLLALSTSALAQGNSPDSVVARARLLAERNDSTAARALLDSAIKSEVSGPVRGELAYWQTRYAPSAADRERALASFIVEHPFAERLPIALFELGSLELARGERDRAALHLQRFVNSGTADSNRVGAALTLGGLLLERGDIARACAVLTAARTIVPETAIELRNRFEFAASRCQGVDTATRKPVPDSIPAARRSGAFTVQVAAYDTKLAADKLATQLRGQGLEARVIGTTKPFRVRVGRYATRSQAEEASRQVDAAAKSKSIVVVVGPEEK